MNTLVAAAGQTEWEATYIFDVWARVNGDDVAMLDAQIVSDYAVDSSGSIIKVIIGEHNQNSVLALLSLDQDGITTEELEGLHRIVRQSDDRVVIIGRICNTVELSAQALHTGMFTLLTSRNSVSSSFSGWRSRCRVRLSSQCQRHRCSRC